MIEYFIWMLLAALVWTFGFVVGRGIGYYKGFDRGIRRARQLNEKQREEWEEWERSTYGSDTSNTE